MTYMENRHRSFMVLQISELKTFMKAEYLPCLPPHTNPPTLFSDSLFRYANSREFMREQSVLTHVSLANELAKALKKQGP